VTLKTKTNIKNPARFNLDIVPQFKSAVDGFVFINAKCQVCFTFMVLSLVLLFDTLIAKYSG